MREKRLLIENSQEAGVARARGKLKWEKERGECGA